MGLIVGATVAGVAVLFLGVVAFMYVFRRRAKISGDINTEESLEYEEKEEHHDNPSIVSLGSGKGSEAEHSKVKIKDHPVKVEDMEQFQ